MFTCLLQLLFPLLFECHLGLVDKSVSQFSFAIGRFSERKEKNPLTPFSSWLDGNRFVSSLYSQQQSKVGSFIRASRLFALHPYFDKRLPGTTRSNRPAAIGTIWQFSHSFYCLLRRFCIDLQKVDIHPDKMAPQPECRPIAFIDVHIYHWMTPFFVVAVKMIAASV